MSTTPGTTATCSRPSRRRAPWSANGRPERHRPAPGAQRINSAGGAKGIATSVAWLTENADEIEPAASAEDWAVETGGEGPLFYHLIQVRAALARQLWQRRLFVGVTVLDELLFRAIRRRLPDPVLEVLAWLADSPLTRPAYVIYPLYSLGLLGAGLLVRPNELTSEQLAREYGVAVLPSTTGWRA
jgi:hypothetical protein